MALRAHTLETGQKFPMRWLLNGHDDKACLIIRTETVLEMLTLFHWLCEDPGPGPLGLAFLPF